MSTKKILPFEIDDKSKTFRFNAKNYQELFKENSEVNTAFKAAIALGCYDGYTPVLVKRVENPDRNTATQNFTSEGVEKWLAVNNPEWFPVWEITREVLAADAKPFPFMVRKNYFLHENAAARLFCGMAADRNYELKPLGHFLKQAVEAKIKQLQTSGEWDDRVQKAAETVKKILSEKQ